MKKRTQKLATSAILCSASVVILYIGAFFNIMDLSIAALAGYIIVWSVIEMNLKTACMIYAVTSILAFLLTPQKFVAVVYLLFFGIYPLFKSLFERLHYIVAWVLKLSFFNTGLLLIVTACVYLLKLPDTGMGFDIALFALGNLAFILYDIATSKLITLYFIKIRSRLRIKNYFEE